MGVVSHYFFVLPLSYSTLGGENSRKRQAETRHLLLKVLVEQRESQSAAKKKKKKKCHLIYSGEGVYVISIPHISHSVQREKTGAGEGVGGQTVGDTAVSQSDGVGPEALVSVHATPCFPL